MRVQHILTTAVSLLIVSGASVDVRKGTDIIPPDSAEAEAIHHSDRAVRTSPKDKTTEELLEGDKFKTSEPKKISNQEDDNDREDATVLSNKKEKSNDVATTDDHPIVLNDYDPNNLGVTTDSKSDINIDSKIENGSKKGTEGSKKDQQTAAPVPETQSPQRKDSRTGSSPNTAKTVKSDKGNFHSLTMAFSMIIFSEIGDKTFLIAALMAMKHSRVTVFSAAFASLAVMSVLSAVLGRALPAFLPKKITSFLAALLFIVFGVKLLREGMEMDASAGIEDEMEEVESEIQSNEMTMTNDDLEKGYGNEKSAKGTVHSLKRNSSIPRLSQDGLDNDDELYTMRSRRNVQSTNFSSVQTTWKQLREGVENLASLVLSPAWVQVFVMTFLGEWGDRSQVATIAMAAGSDYWLVILGTIAGHCLCTAAAVVGGKFLATKISIRQVTLAGAFAFLIFSIIYFFEAVSLEWSE